MTAVAIADSVKTRALNDAASTPRARAAVCEPCSARSARPGRAVDEIAGEPQRRDQDRHEQPSTTALSPEIVKPSKLKSGADMPSGPPVSPVSLVSAIVAITPTPSVAMAR